MAAHSRPAALLSGNLLSGRGHASKMSAHHVGPFGPGLVRTWAAMPASRCSTLFAGRSQQRWASGSPRKLPRVMPPKFAFAFDIDGVLLHSAQPIPGASESLNYLQDHNIPFIVLTNGGGKPEADRVAELSAKLNVPLTTANFIQSHTPFQELVDDHNADNSDGDGLRNKTVLVTGSDPERSRMIAEGYGFRSVITPADLLAAAPAIWPFNPLMRDVYANTARPLPKPLYNPDMGMDSLSECLKIDAIFVFNDPRDWALDIQLITDLMLSHAGYLGTYSRFNRSNASSNMSESHGGWQQDGQPRLFFSNPDLFWSTGYHLPRFGQGAFQAAMRGVWSRVTEGKELICTVIGKPHRETYRFAERKLAVHQKNLLARLKGHHRSEEESSELRTVYMVGDNPESDIAGANTYRSELGADWQSILVKTGVWNPERTGGVEGLKGRLKPDLVVNDVQSAVVEALRREGWEHSAFPER